MSYHVYLGTMLCPVPPAKIDIKIKGQNQTLTLINEGEINILKAPGLTEISFDLLLPNVRYPFAEYNIVWKNAQWFLNRLEDLKTKKKVFQFIVTRTFPSGKALFDTNIKVSLEDYTIKEDKKEGFDFVVSIKLKQAKDYGTKTFNGTLQPTRSTENAPTTQKYTVEKGDCLWNIAKEFYGQGSKYPVIYSANKSVIGGNPHLIYPGQVLTIPGVSGSTSNGSMVESSSGSVSSATTAKRTIKINLSNYLQVDANLRVHFTRNGKSQYKDIPVSSLGHSSSNSIDVDNGTEVLFAPSYKGKLGNYGQDGVVTPVSCNNRRVSLVTVSKSHTGSQVKAKINVNATFDIYWNLYFNKYGGKGGKF